MIQRLALFATVVVAQAPPAAAQQIPPVRVPDLAAVIDLGVLYRYDHVLFEGIVDSDVLGERLMSLGDLNGDGLADFLLGAPRSAQGGAGGKSGFVYVLFAGPHLRDGLDLATLDGTQGFAIQGGGSLDELGRGIDGIGDWNQDGYADMALGSNNAFGAKGGVYVLFGGPSLGAGGTVDLGSLDGTQGFAIQGVEVGSRTGNALAGLGDVNEDGAPDLLIGAPRRVASEATWSVDPGEKFVEAADFDADGDVDLVLSNGQDKSITTWRNDGTGSFSLLQTLLLKNRPQWHRLDDLSGDGVPDLLYITYLAGGVTELHVRINPGNGNFQVPKATYPVDGCWAPFDVGDVNGDGALDVVVASGPSPYCSGSTGEFLQVYLNGGAGLLSAPAILPLPNGPRGIDLADLDQDGDLDGMLAMDGAGGPEVQAVLNDGTGAFALGDALAVTSSKLWDIGAVDLEGDGYPDAYLSGGAFEIVRNDGLGGWASSELVPSDHGPALGIEVADMNGDGHADLVGCDGQSLVVATSRGDGSVAPAQRYTHLENILDVVVLDANGDGVPDVCGVADEIAYLHLNRGAGWLEGRYRGEAYVVFGGSTVGAGGLLDLADLDGTNGFVVEGPHGEAYTGNACAAPGDLDGDGIPDFAIGSFGASLMGAERGATFVLFGRAGLGSSGRIEFTQLDGTDGFIVGGAKRGHEVPSSLGGADLDGDGLAELVLGAPSAGDGRVYVVRGGPGLGAGGQLDLGDLDGIQGQTLRGAGKLGEAVAAGADFDGDGRGDLLLGAPVSEKNGTAFLVYGKTLFGAPSLDLNTLDGWSGSRFLSEGSGGYLGLGVGWGDLDGDGSPDLALGAPFLDTADFDSAGRVYVFFGKN